MLPEHVQTVFPAIAATSPESRSKATRAERGSEIADALIRAVPVPV